MLLRALICTACFTPYCIIFVFVTCYVLFPVFLERKKYVAFISGFMLMIGIGVVFDYFAATIYFKAASVNHLNTVQKIFVSINFLWSAIIAGGLVLGIKLAKKSYRQHQKNQLLIRQKAITELKLLKAQIQPDFLLGTLDIIYEKINSGSLKSHLIILKLSEVLSYFLYESDQHLVPLEKEVAATNDFISISRMTIAGENLSLQVTGAVIDKFIAPMLLLSTIKNILSKIYAEKSRLQKTAIIISTDGDYLMAGITILHVEHGMNMLKAFIRSEEQRLNLWYPENNCVLGISVNNAVAEINLIASLNNMETSMVKSNKDISNEELYESV